jgi:uncharacterized protein
LNSYLPPKVGTNQGLPGRVDWRSVGLYLALAFGWSWAAFIGLRALGVPFVPRTLVGMFGPALAAALTRLLRREGFRDLGLRLSRSGRPDLSYLYAYLVPLLLLACGAALALLIGRQHWALTENWDRLITQQLGSAGGAAAASRKTLLSLLPVVVLATLTLSVAINCVATTGEELGWRGHLLVRLTPLGGPPAAILTGVVWGLWHAPVIGLDGYEYGIRNWLLAAYFCLLTVPLGAILAWLRFRSGSVWPCVLAHATINSAAGLVVLGLSPPPNTLLAPPVGLLGVAPFWAFAAWLLGSGRLRPTPARSERTLPADAHPEGI